MVTASKNIFWLTASRISALVMLFFAYTLLFRYLGPTVSGQHQFVLSFVTVFGVVIDLGIQQYITKKISEDPENAKKYFQNFFAVEFLLCIFVFFAIIGTAKLAGYSGAVFGAIAMAGFGTALNGLTYPFLSTMSAFQNLKKVALVNFLSSVTNALFIFSTVFFHRGIVFLVTNQVVFAVISIFLYYNYVKAHVPKPDLFKAIRSLDYDLVKKIMKAALPFALLVGFSTIYNRLDVILITRLLGFTETGLYTAAYKFFDLVSFFPAVVSHALYPVFTGLIAKGDSLNAKTLFEKYFRFMFAIALPMGVAGSLLAPKIMQVLAGSAFAESAQVLSILVWASVMLFIYIIANSIVISQLTKFAVGITFTNIFINLIGNLILLPRIGIKGAAIMTIISETVQGIFYFYFVYKKIVKFSVVNFLWQPLVASLGMGILLFYVKEQNIILSSALGGISYLLILGLTGFLNKSDIHFVKGIFGRGGVV